MTLFFWHAHFGLKYISQAPNYLVEACQPPDLNLLVSGTPRVCHFLLFALLQFRPLRALYSSGAIMAKLRTKIYHNRQITDAGH